MPQSSLVYKSYPCIYGSERRCVVVQQGTPEFEARYTINDNFDFNEDGYCYFEGKNIGKWYYDFNNMFRKIWSDNKTFNDIKKLENLYFKYASRQEKRKKAYLDFIQHCADNLEPNGTNNSPACSKENATHIILDAVPFVDGFSSLSGYTKDKILRYYIDYRSTVRSGTTVYPVSKAIVERQKSTKLINHDHGQKLYILERTCRSDIMFRNAVNIKRLLNNKFYFLIESEFNYSNISYNKNNIYTFCFEINGRKYSFWSEDNLGKYNFTGVDGELFHKRLTID